MCEAGEEPAQIADEIDASSSRLSATFKRDERDTVEWFVS